MKRLFLRYREIIMYFIFGVFTSIVSWGTYFLIMGGGRWMLGLETGDVTSGRYIALYTAAQLISWVCAVLFAFFTNRTFVFTDVDKNVPVIKQFAAFASGRLLTLGLDYIVTYSGTLLLLHIIDGSEGWAETAAKITASLIVTAVNYIYVKLFVFRKKKEER